MRVSMPGVSVLALAIGIGLLGGRGQAEAQSLTGRYIVRFSEAPLATYAGGEHDRKSGAALLPTSPLATGARRLDVDAPASLAYLAFLASRREQRLQVAGERIGRRMTPERVFQAALNGVVLSLTPAEARELSQLPGVLDVEPERWDRPQDDVSTQLVGAPTVWADAAFTGRSRGEGIVVGVVDSGIHASHPSFAAVSAVDGHTHANPRGRVYGLCTTGGATCNNKLIGIWDMTTSGTEADNGLDLDGHGTHVAGTAVGNPVNLIRSFGGGSLNYQIRGVAPRANLITYKACEAGSCSSTWTTAALEQALVDGVDVVNYSIGGTASSPWSRSDSQAMLSLRNAGIVVAVSAGNSGPDFSTIRSPSDAPWVVGVANTTHGRRYANRLLLSGGGSAAPSGGILIGEALTGGVGPVAITRDPAQPLCSIGSGDQTLPVTGASNPWPAGFWSGQIVVCNRGVQARVAKSNNVRLSGGSGMVLLNTAAEGESVVADEHSIPSTHLGYTDGQALLAWLATGTGHTARLEGTAVIADASRADVIAGSSARGPATTTQLLKPDVAAPGTSIQSADHDSNADAVLSGTSMASPHVAGAAAVLMAARPGWRADEVVSALATTALPRVKRDDRISGANALEQGSGVIDLPTAVKAALSLPSTSSGWTAGQADPSTMNLPQLVSRSCSPVCPTLTRRFRDLVGGGSYNVQMNLPTGVVASASSNSFTLTSGQTVTLNFDFRIADPSLYGRWIEGEVVLQRVTSDGRSNTRLPVLLRTDVTGVPGAQIVSVNSERGRADLTLPGFNLALPALRLAGTPLATPVATNYSLSADATPSDVYDNLSNGVGWHALSVPAPTNGRPLRYRVDVSLSAPVGSSATLYVGNGAGPGSRNQMCSSATRCTFEAEHPGTGSGRSYWVLVQNRSGTQSFTTTHHVTLYRPATSSERHRMEVVGPGIATANQSIPARIHWDDAGLLPGQRRHGAVLVYAGSSDIPLAAVPLTLDRPQAATEDAPYLMGSGETRSLSLAGADTHTRLFIDVPVGATSLSVSTASSANIDLLLARVAAPEASVAIPTIPSAPSPESATVRAETLSGNETLNITLPAAGRWYLMPANRTASTASVDVTATVAGSSPSLRAGGYFNSGRGGHGLFIHPAGTVWSGLWYTYFADGSPTWYYLEGAAPTAMGQWHPQIYRGTWNGSSRFLTIVGRATVTPTGIDAFTFSYNLEGETGSEAFGLFGKGCPLVAGLPANVSQHYFDPTRTGSGYSIQLMTQPANYEFHAAFVYDAVGQPRFLVAESNPHRSDASATLTLEQLTGFCPLCTRSASPVRTAVGTLSRTITSGDLATITLNAAFVQGVPGSWSVTDTVQMLDPQRRPQGCSL